MTESPFRVLRRAVSPVVVFVLLGAPGASAQAPRLTLADALRIAAGQNESIDIARAGEARADAEQLRVQSLRRPQMSFLGTYSRTLASEFSGAFNSSGPSCAPLAVNASAPVAERLAELERAANCGAILPDLGFDNLPFGQRNIYQFQLSFSQTVYSGGRIGAESLRASDARRATGIGPTAAEAQLSLDVTQAFFAQALRPAFAGVDVGDWVDPTGKTRDVTVRLAPAARAHASDLSSLPLVVPDAEGRPTTVPLGQVATITPSLGPTRIDHLDRERVISVQANTEGRPLSDVVADIQTRIDAMPLGAGYSITQGGQTAEQQEVFTRILVSLVVGVLLMYLVLVVQFGSFLDPLAIMISLPLSLIGVVGALMLTGDTLNIMSLIGVILLMGIVAKNAILLIDFAKWSEEKGLPRREAIVEAGRARLRPILMTTLALIAGMIPVALGRGEGADFRAPLGRAIIGGVITSTLLTLLVIPTFYDILAGMRDRVRRLFGRGPPAPSRAGAGEAGLVGRFAPATGPFGRSGLRWSCSRREAIE